MGDRRNVIISGGSGKIVVEGKEKVEICRDENEKEKMSVMGKEIGSSKMLVGDKMRKE